MAVRKRKEYGRYIVSDPEICGGELTFKGTRILVKDALFYVGRGKSWDWIADAYDGSINPEAIAEAINIANQALSEKAPKNRQAA